MLAILHWFLWWRYIWFPPPGKRANEPPLINHMQPQVREAVRQPPGCLAPVWSLLNSRGAHPPR